MGIFTAIAEFIDSIFSGLYSRILVVVIILLIGFILAKLLAKIVRRVIEEVELTSIIQKAAGVKVNFESILGYFVEYFVYFVTIIMALNQLNITTPVLTMISIAVFIIIIISVGLAIKDFEPNAIAGIFIYKKKLVSIGEIIRVKGLEGKVVEITLVETKLETKEGDTVYIPNGTLTKTEIVKVGGEKKSEEKKRSKNKNEAAL